jgi:hypothetical protein
MRSCISPGHVQDTEGVTTIREVKKQNGRNVSLFNIFFESEFSLLIGLSQLAGHQTLNKMRYRLPSD